MTALADAAERFKLRLTEIFHETDLYYLCTGRTPGGKSKGQFFVPGRVIQHHRGVSDPALVIDNVTHLVCHLTGKHRKQDGSIIADPDLVADEISRVIGRRIHCRRL